MTSLPETIIDRLAYNAACRPHTTAFVVLENEPANERTITYAQLSSRVKSLAADCMYRQLEGKRVVLVYQDVLEFIIAFLACQYAGIVAVPVPYMKGSKHNARLLAILKDAAASAIFCTGQSIVQLQKERAAYSQAAVPEIIPTDDTGSLYTGPVNEPSRINELAFIQYTSGSTDTPKGVIITAGNLMHNQLLIEKTFGCNTDSVIFTWLPFHHDMGLIGNILHTIHIGCTCIILSPYHFMQSPIKWLQGITQYKVTHSGGPNFAYDLCVDKIQEEQLSRLDLSSWQVAYNGSEPVRAKTISRFTDHFSSVGFKKQSFYPCYGLAEATLLVSGRKDQSAPLTIYIARQLNSNNQIVLSNEQDTLSQEIVSAGIVAPEMELNIISPQDQKECDELVEGEVCIAGKSVTSGYWNKNNEHHYYRLNNQLFLKTGDIGFWYKGELFIHGRLKEMIIIRGRNYFPADIEVMAVHADEAIEPNGLAIFSTNNTDDEFVIVAEIKRTFLRSIDGPAIITAIDKIVNGVFGINAHDIILTTPWSIPRTTSGKLQRIKCKGHYLQNEFQVIASKQFLKKNNTRVERDETFLSAVMREPGYNSIKNYLVNVIESRIGPLDARLTSNETELTEMGIDSLRAMELINIINKDLHISINATMIFRENNLSGFIQTIENLLWLNNTRTSGKELTI
jgi:acyl-CoA synthetase (AMP-forming)/AMP-acid ligase II/acyl carrier protein